MKTTHQALNSCGDRTLSGSFFWDGKRFWIWNGHDNRYRDYSSANFNLHAKFRKPAPEKSVIKERYFVHAALPLALHAAGDLVQSDGKTVLCTEDILPFDDREEGPFPFIAGIVTGILGKEGEEFIRWLSRAYAFTRFESDLPPEFMCVVGSCNSSKGLLAVLASITLCGHPYPRRLNLVLDGFSKPQSSDFSKLVCQIDLASDPSKIKRLEKFFGVESSTKEFRGVRLETRQIFMMRCHEGNWRPWWESLPKITSGPFIPFVAASAFSIAVEKERMPSKRVCENIEKEIRAFRNHLVTCEKKSLPFNAPAALRVR